MIPDPCGGGSPAVGSGRAKKFLNNYIEPRERGLERVGCDATRRYAMAVMIVVVVVIVVVVIV